MNATHKPREEQSLHYHWPIWFGEDFEGELSQGQMANLSSTAAAFTCYADERCPYPGQQVTARFSVPRYGPDDSFDMVDFIRSGQVCHVDGVNSALRRVVMQFAEPLSFRPGEQRTSAQLAQRIEDDRASLFI
jgi:hypothetical protein